jgi:hypothetical protein
MGVMQVVLKSWIFGAYPEYFWLYCLVQWPVCLAFRATKGWKTRTHLYLLEYCWIVNFMGYIWLFFEFYTQWMDTSFPYFTT